MIYMVMDGYKTQISSKPACLKQYNKKQKSQKPYEVEP